MVEDVNDFGEFRIVVTDELCDTGEYEIRVEDENGNILDADTKNFDFYRKQYDQRRVKKFLEECLTNNRLIGEDEDFDEGFSDLKSTWQESLREWEGNIRAYGTPEVPEKEGKSDIERWRDEEIEQEADSLLRNPFLLLKIDDAIHQFMTKEYRNAMVNFVTGASTLTPEPMNLRWSGRSAIGKSKISTATARVFPDDWLMVYIGMTRKSMYYDPSAEETRNGREVSLDGKILLILEEGNAREFLEEAKPILSHDMEEHKYPFTDTSGSKTETKYITLKGWPSYIGLSVTSEMSIELGTRELTGTPRMGENKYGRVVDWKALKAFVPWATRVDERKVAIVKRAISMLEEKEVWIPFTPTLRRYFPTDQARSQRDWDKLEAAIKTIAIVHQRQRDCVFVDGEELLVAHPFDGLVAIDVIESAMEEAMTGLNRDQIKFHRHIAKESKEREVSRWTYKDLMDEFKSEFGESISRTTVERRYVDPLVEVGVFGRDDEPKAHEMWVSSPLQSSNLSNLEKMREELSDIDYGEEYIENQLLTGCRMVGDNPGPDFEIESNVPPSSPSPYEDAISNLRYRFFKAEKERDLDWGLGRSEGSKGEEEEGGKVVSIEDLGSPDWGTCDECGMKEAEYKHPRTGRKLCENCWEEMGFGRREV